MERTRGRGGECPVTIKHAWVFFSQTLFVLLAWVLTGRQNKPRWNRVCKQACEYRHETHKLAPRPDEYASAGIGASAASRDQSTQPSRVKVNRKTKARNLFFQGRWNTRFLIFFFGPDFCTQEYLIATERHVANITVKWILKKAARLWPLLYIKPSCYSNN